VKTYLRLRPVIKMGRPVPLKIPKGKKEKAWFAGK
jgi:hypothetical protein